MLTSKGPSGQIEAYTDIGQFIGILPPDHPLAKTVAKDGGPGSGNWGHSGRPGLVGGSGPGGGSQYRGGRSDVGYFGSRKDWLNGLSGERQHEAARFVAAAKRAKNEAFEAKEARIKHAEKLKGQGLITEKEYDDIVSGFKDITEKTTPEEYIMKYHPMKGDKKRLLDFIGEARNWKENALKLQAANLSNEEKKYLSMLALEVGKAENITREDLRHNNLDDAFDEMSPEEQEFYLDIKAKACGIPNSGKKIEEYPDDFQVEVGAKEKPVVKKFNWMGPENQLQGWEWDNSFTHLIQRAGGVLPSDMKKFKTNEDVENALQDMVNRISNSDRFDVNMAASSKSAMYMVGRAKGIDWGEELYGAFRGKPIQNLTEEETNRMVEILKNKPDRPTYIGNIGDKPYRDEQDMFDDFILPAAGKSYEDEVREYALLKCKALGLPEPESREVVERKAQQKKEAEAKKLKDFLEKRSEREANYNKASTAKEVDSAIVSSGMFKDNAEVDLRGTSVFCARDAAVYADRFMCRFPFLYGKLGGIKGWNLGSSTFADSARGTTGIVRLNDDPSYFGSLRAVADKYDDDVRTGYHPVGTDYTSIFTHEFAHSLGGWLTKHKVFGSEEGSEGHHFESRLRLSVLRKMKLTKASVGKELSRYAEKNSHEWFAEAMAEALHSENPRPMAVECFKQLEEILKKEGLIDGPLQRVL